MRDNVLAGVERRDTPMVEVLPRRAARIVNATFRLDEMALAHARGPALLEGTSVNALIAQLISEYSGVAVPPPPPSPPQPTRRRVRMTDTSYR